MSQSSGPFIKASIQVQNRLFNLAVGFLALYAILLTISPAVRLRTWNVEYLWLHWIGFVVWLTGFALLNRQFARLIPDVDPFLLPVVALLTGWGNLTIWRLDPAFGMRQTLWLALGLVLFYYGLLFPWVLNLLRRYKYLWLVSGLLLTALTFVLGTYPGGVGPRLWLGCCGVYLQPSEPLKLLLIIYLAAYLADRIPVSFSLLGLTAPTLILLGAALVLLMIQRDLGTATLFILIYTITIYLASGRKRMILLSVSTLALAGYLGYRLVSVVRTRVDAWINPWVDPSGNSYQIVQSIMAVASGGLIGRGPGLGNPGVVPVAHSDFIFSAIAEETGLVGVFALLTLLALLFVRSLRVALYAPYNYHRYLAAGISAYFAAQALIIIGGNLRVFPLTGVTLPFMSYGGSSLLTSLAGLLILVNISRQSEEDPAPLASTTPYYFAGSVILIAFVALATISGWWSVFRQEGLANRNDNPRRTIADRYVLRGSLLDRNNRPIDVSSGMPGSYQRSYLVPNLSATTGYTNPLYGQAGLEASQDAYLRGMDGIPSSVIWWNHILYGQPPPGLNVRLSIDLDLQAHTDGYFAGHLGAAVMMNASTGEILVLASHPNFDPNKLDENWDSLVNSPDAPFLNRVTQGQYSPGAVLGPFILASYLSRDNLPELPAQLSSGSGDGAPTPCALNPQESTSWGSVISSGCPGPLSLLSKRFQPAGMDTLFNNLGFYSQPSLPLATAPVNKKLVENVDRAGIGQENISLTPLQVAIAASALSSNGVLPAPLLTMAVHSPYQGWIVLPHGQTNPVFPLTAAAQAASLLAQPGDFYWQTLAVAASKDKKVTWFVGGTLSQWKGSPLSLVVLLEEDNPMLAEKIGRDLLQLAMNP